MQQSIFATENDLTSLKNDMKKTKLENQQQVWKGCKKTTGQTESMAHSENVVCRLSTHRKKPLQFLLKK